MWRFFMFFIVLLASVYVGTTLQHHSGYIYITFGNWSLETSLWVGIPGLLLLVCCIHALLAVRHYITSLPSRWHSWREYRRIRQAQAETRRGLIEFSEGHWQMAKKHLMNALPNAETPLLNYLTAARAAQELGENKLRDDCLRQAQQSMPEAKIAVELTQAQLQLANQQWEQARATLKHLQDLAPHHPYVLKLLMQLYEAIQDWDQLIALLPQLKRYQILEGIVFEQKQQHYMGQALRHLIKLDQDEKIQIFIKNIPKKLKYDGEISAMHAEYLLAHQQEKKAEIILHRSLQHEITDSCLRHYGKLPPNVVNLSFIESLSHNLSHAASIQLCLGRLCCAQQLWGKARSHFEESIQRHPTAEAYAELGKLFEHIKQDSLACEAYKQGLMLQI